MYVCASNLWWGSPVWIIVKWALGVCASTRRTITYLHQSAPHTHFSFGRLGMRYVHANYLPQLFWRMLSDSLECRCDQLEDEDTGRLLRVRCHCSMCTAHRKWLLHWAVLEQSLVHNLREVPILYQEELDHGWSLLGVESCCSFAQICASLLSHLPAVLHSDQTVVDQLYRKVTCMCIASFLAFFAVHILQYTQQRRMGDFIMWMST